MSRSPVDISQISRKSRVLNDQFDGRLGFQLGRPSALFVPRHPCKCLFSLLPLQWPSTSKSTLLRWFGTSVGRGVPVTATTAGRYGVSTALPLVTVSDAPSAGAERIQARSEPAAADIRSLAAFTEEFSWPKLARKLVKILENKLQRTSIGL